ncbi:hypothetical protein D3C72_1069140 [compost metagenome]
MATGREIVPDVVHKAHDVYGITRELPLNYVVRKDIDGRFVDALTRKKHVIIHGGSKQGKTSLRKYNLDDDSYVSITCQTNWSHSTLMGAILKAAGFRVSTLARPDRALGGGFKIKAEFSPPIPGLKLGAEVEANASPGGARGREFQLEIDSSDTNDVIAALQESGFDKRIVLEDFHYLPITTQQQFAFALKSFHDNSDYTFIVIGVWKESSRLTRYNGDLNLRVISIDADLWTAPELEEVIDAGEILLNVKFTDDFKSDLIQASFESVYLVQEACYRSCQIAGITETCISPCVIGNNISAKEMVRQVVKEQTGRYQTFLMDFSRGFQDTKLDMYRWLCFSVLRCSVKEMTDGLTLKKVMAIVRSKHPEGDKVSAASFTNALSNVAYLQAQKDVRPIILDYDENNRRLDVVDKGFLIWKSTIDIDEQLDVLDLPTS